MKYRALLVCFVLIAQPAAAANLWCTGLLNRLLVYGNGTVMIYADWNVGWLTVCNVAQDRLGVSKDACKTWVALLESAKAQGTEVGVNYDTETYTCPTIPAYGASPAPQAISPQ